MSAYNVGRFASPNRTEEYVFPGPCRCPGTPHEHDVAQVRVAIGASAKARIGRAELEGAIRLDPLASHRQVILEGVVSWNLLWPNPAQDDPAMAAADPVPVPINESTVELLDEDLVPLAEFADRLWSSGDPVPNASGAPSRGSRRGSASPTRTPTPTPGT